MKPFDGVSYGTSKRGNTVTIGSSPAPGLAAGQIEAYQNYPNPLNPETWIPYQLSADTEVTIKITMYPDA